MIRFVDVIKQYNSNDSPALKSLTLKINPGEFLALVGESGSGKTTLLKLVNRLIEPTSGAITVSGSDISQTDPITLRRQIGYIFQGIGLFPHMTIESNVSIIMKMLGWDDERIDSRIDELLGLVSMPPSRFRTRMPSELSGGQKQRVGIARALSVEPKILLMDEPFGALDPITRDSMQTEMRSLQKRLNLTVIMVTHDMLEAIMMGDRVAVMQEGSLLQLGSPAELLNSPAHPYVEQLLAMPRRHAQAFETLQRENEKN